MENWYLDSKLIYLTAPDTNQNYDDDLPDCPSMDDTEDQMDENCTDTTNECSASVMCGRGSYCCLSKCGTHKCVNIIYGEYTLYCKTLVRNVVL